VLVAPFPLFPVHEASQSTLYVQQVATDGNSGTIISELRNAMDFKPEQSGQNNSGASDASLVLESLRNGLRHHPKLTSAVLKVTKAV
jgi:hypothetical protein